MHKIASWRTPHFPFIIPIKLVILVILVILLME
jgi:hypothetical protein